MSQQNSNLNTGDIPLFPATEDNPKSHLEQAINELTHVILTSDEPFNFSYSDPNSDKTITLSHIATHSAISWDIKIVVTFVALSIS